MNKVIITTLLLLVAFQANAVKCSKYIPPNDEEITIKESHGIFSFSTPAQLEGNELKSFYLFSAPSDKDGAGVIAVPVAFKIKDGYAVGDFSILKKGVFVDVTATYTGEICGPRLEATTST